MSEVTITLKTEVAIGWFVVTIALLDPTETLDGIKVNHCYWTVAKDRMFLKSCIQFPSIHLIVEWEEKWTMLENKKFAYQVRDRAPAMCSEWTKLPMDVSGIVVQYIDRTNYFEFPFSFKASDNLRAFDDCFYDSLAIATELVTEYVKANILNWCCEYAGPYEMDESGNLRKYRFRDVHYTLEPCGLTQVFIENRSEQALYFHVRNLQVQICETFFNFEHLEHPNLMFRKTFSGPSPAIALGECGKLFCMGTLHRISPFRTC